MTRPLGAIANIDSLAFAHNLARVRSIAPRSRVLAVIKADGYGHGLLNVARALRDADGFAVARLLEAERLRAAGMMQRIVLLPGVHDANELALASRLALDVAVHHRMQIELLEQAPPGVRVNVWLKVDSGMHRLGLPPPAVSEAHARLSRCTALNEPLRVMTHLADADDMDKNMTAEQIDAVRECTAALNVELSIGNSAGVMAWPGARSEWVRPGIMLYGVSPFAGECGLDHDLRPAMTLSTRLLAVNDIAQGGAIGYGGTYTTPQAMPVGAAAAGYADGYPRHVPNGTPVLVDGVSAPIAGRVSMDTITVDLRGHETAQLGSRVVLWGYGLPVETVARAAGTIGYELLCRVGSRVPRVVGVV
jgi:alanine racemase